MPDLWYDVDAALSAVPINLIALIDDTDFKAREVALTASAVGMDLTWNFAKTDGSFSQTAVVTQVVCG